MRNARHSGGTTAGGAALVLVLALGACALLAAGPQRALRTLRRSLVRFASTVTLGAVHPADDDDADDEDWDELWGGANGGFPAGEVVERAHLAAPPPPLLPPRAHAHAVAANATTRPVPEHLAQPYFADPVQHALLNTLWNRARALDGDGGGPDTDDDGGGGGGGGGARLRRAAARAASQPGGAVPPGVGAPAVPCRFASLFRDHAVLQRAQRVPVWGFASPGVTASVTWRRKTRRATAGADGVWRVVLPPMPASARIAADGHHASESLSLACNTGEPAVVLRDVLVGDVLLCTGQSNMHMPVREDGDGDSDGDGDGELAHVDAAGAGGGSTSYASIRVTTVGHCGVSAHQPHADFQYVDQPWAPVTGAHALAGPSWGYFSAACWHTGKAVFSALGRRVPLGLVSAAWRGTPIQAWMTPDSAELCAAELAAVALAREGQRGGGSVTRAPAPPSVSHTPLPPAQPAATSPAAARGSVRQLSRWWRQWARRRLAAGVARRAGVRSSSSSSSSRRRQRRRQSRGSPTRALSPSPLAGGRCDLGASERPSALGAVFNGLVHPLTVGPLALRAVLWYQGESNTGVGLQDAALVRCALPALILDWRARFGRAAAAAAAGQTQPALLPTGAVAPHVASPWERRADDGGGSSEEDADSFEDESARDDANALGWYFVQLAPWVFHAATPPWDGPIAPVRAAQLAALALPRTAFATAADLGDVGSPLVGGSIHPRGKRLVGLRLARAVLAMEYGAPRLPWRGPMVRRAVALPTPAAAAAAPTNASSGGGATAVVVVQFHAATCAGGGRGGGAHLQLVDPGGCPLLDARRTDPEYVGGKHAAVAPAAASWIRCGGLELQCSPGAWVEAAAEPFALPPGASLPAPPAALAAQPGGLSFGDDDGGSEGACLLRVAPRDAAALAPGACARPLRVRYGDGNWPLLSIYDAAGLPAVPFEVEVA